MSYQRDDRRSQASETTARTSTPSVGHSSLTASLGASDAEPVQMNALLIPASRWDGSVQRRAMVGGAELDAGVTPAPSVHAAAQHGIAGGGGPMPFHEEITRSFGRHDISGIRAHTGESAREGASAMGASAYATGNHVVFGGAPDLHTAAHEAAHVVQQRAGVHLAGGVGVAGDAYERHADAVADKVVRGESAEALLDQHAGGGGGTGGTGVQQKVFIKNNAFMEKVRGATHREKTKTGRGAGSEAHIDDAAKYYFDSKDEMEAYADDRSTTVGWMGNTWVHVPDTMTVLGEQHGSPHTLMAIVAETGTTQYLYEGVVEAPAQAQPNAGLDASIAERSHEVADEKGANDPTQANAGEAFLPKMIRMLAEVTITATNVTANNAHGRRALAQGILYAQADGGALHASYVTHQAVLDPILAAEGDPATANNAPGAAAVRAFVDAFLVVARAGAAADRASMSRREQAHFDRHWDAAGSARYVSAGDTPEHRLADEGDNARDLSMYKHIKAGKSAGKKLYGLGDNHRKRLAPLLDADGIPHQTVSEWVAEQRAKHPQ
jgi:hypothetical protein